MSLTKKHYETIAKEVRSLLAMCDTKHATTVTKLHAYNLADYFAQDNPRFDRARFLQACGIEQKKYTAVTCDVHKNYSTECDCNLIKSQT